MEAGEALHFATRDHYLMWFTGKTERHGPTEKILSRLVKMGELKSFRYGKKYIYCRPDRLIYPLDKLHHGLVCSDALVSLLKCDPTAEVVPEKWFQSQKWSRVPEWGLIYPKAVLLFEFCTADNISRGQVKVKAEKYQETIPAIQEAFGRPPVVLFLLEEDKVKTAERSKAHQGFYLTDVSSFYGLGPGLHLTAPIYFWGGKATPLRHGP
jgi:hypothetical protein